MAENMVPESELKAAYHHQGELAAGLAYLVTAVRKVSVESEDYRMPEQIENLIGKALEISRGVE